MCDCASCEKIRQEYGSVEAYLASHDELEVVDDADLANEFRLAAEVSARRILKAFTVVPVMLPRSDGKTVAAGSDDPWADDLDITFWELGRDR